MTQFPASDAVLLSALSDLIAPPGFEGEVTDWIRPRIEPLAERVELDPLGNLLVWLPAAEGAERTVMIDAHTDEIGFILSHIGDDGFISFAPLGGWDPRVVPAQPVTILTRAGARIRGAIGFPPPHIQRGERKVMDIKDLRIDVGAADADEVAAMGIRIGDPAAIHFPCAPLGAAPDDGSEPEVLVGKAFDDRAGCAAAIRLAERLSADLPADVRVVLSFSASEEVGLRGARTAAFTLQPDFALALEGTTAGDMPGVKSSDCPTRQRDGAAISVADRTLVVPRRLVAFAERLAEENDIPAQLKLPSSGGTDAGAIHLTRGGVPSMVISNPCRYIHSPVSTLRIADFQAVVDLSEKVVRGVGQELFGG